MNKLVRRLKFQRYISVFSLQEYLMVDCILKILLHVKKPVMNEEMLSFFSAIKNLTFESAATVAYRP